MSKRPASPERKSRDFVRKRANGLYFGEGRILKQQGFLGADDLGRELLLGGVENLNLELLAQRPKRNFHLLQLGRVV